MNITWTSPFSLRRASGHWLAGKINTSISGVRSFIGAGTFQYRVNNKTRAVNYLSTNSPLFSACAGSHNELGNRACNSLKCPKMTFPVIPRIRLRMNGTKIPLQHTMYFTHLPQARSNLNIIAQIWCLQQALPDESLYSMFQRI